MSSPSNLNNAAKASFNTAPTPAPPTKEECLKLCPECGADLQKQSVVKNINTPATPGEMAPTPSESKNSLGPESPVEPPKGVFSRLKGFFGLGGRRRGTRAHRKAGSRKQRCRKGTRKHRRSAGNRKH